jgi:hypothetical protein
MCFYTSEEIGNFIAGSNFPVFSSKMIVFGLQFNQCTYKSALALATQKKKLWIGSPSLCAGLMEPCQKFSRCNAWA